MTRIRPFREADAPAAASLLRDRQPAFIVTAPLLTHWLRQTPERAHARYWVAEDDGELVGCADAQLDWIVKREGVGELWIGVRPNARGRGIGGRLYEVAETHLLERGAWKLRTHVDEDEAGRRFAERRGFVQTRSERLSELDVRAADLTELPALEAEKAKEGFAVVPLRQLLDNRPALHALYAEATADSPSDDPVGQIDFDEWERETMASPVLDPDGSMNVVHGDTPVSLAWLGVDRDGNRAEHEFTGTLRAYRGRRLARLAKLAAIRACRESGIQTLVTGNDATNAPMLAINDRLGYRPTIVRTELAKEMRSVRAA